MVPFPHFCLLFCILFILSSLPTPSRHRIFPSTLTTQLPPMRSTWRFSLPPPLFSLTEAMI